MRASRIAACLGLLALAVPVQAAETATGDVRIGVAPFERVAPGDAVLPDVATLIADRLGTSGVHAVVGPDVAPTAGADPPSEAVVAWAEESKLDALVVGRTTLVGRRLSIDVRVRDGETGQSAGTYVAEVADSQDLPAAVDRLSEQILGGTQLAIDGLPAVAAARPPGGATAVPGVAAPESPARQKNDGPGVFKRENGPISIRSDELEAEQNGNKRKFIFRRNVRVSQGAMRLRARELEAFYPPGKSQPERLVASGNVVMSQDGRTVSCDVATFYRSEDRVVCRGNAVMEEAGDTVEGEEIEFHLDTERLFVRGDARVQMAADEAAGDTQEATP